MLCNYCGKSLEGRASVCPECSKLHGRASTQDNQSPQEATPSVAISHDHSVNLPKADTRLPIEGSPRRGLRFHRFVAFMVDSAIMGIPVALISGILKSYLISPLLLPDPMAGGMSMMLMVAMPFFGVLLAFLAASLLVPPVYYTLMESGAWQATVGKRLLGLYVVNQNGSRCSPREAVTRYLGKVLLPFCTLLIAVLLTLSTTALSKAGPSAMTILIGLAGVLSYVFVSWQIYIAYLYSPTRQGLHDRIAKCYVVTRDNHPSYAIAALVLTGALITSATINALTPSAPAKSMPTQFPGVKNDPFDLEGLESLPSLNGPTESKREGYVPPPRETLPTIAPESYNPSPPPRQPIFAPIPVEPPVALAPNTELKDQPPPPMVDGTTVTFGRVNRELTSSAAIMNSSRTELRVYLGQRDFTPEEIARLESSTDGNPIGRADMVIVASYPNPVDSDCSFSKAIAIQVLLYRTGITGFPLPGRNSYLRITPTTTSSEKLLCGPSRSTRDKPGSQITISGILRGEGSYSQGEAAWPVSWNVKVGG
jgi:uncharacterized RDD family membrane protein YckC